MHIARIVLVAMLLCGWSSAQADDMPELATLLSLFSANATDDGNIRLNWSLDQQSPAVVKFRIYRGYEELGAFSVLTEVPFHAGSAEYLLNDSSAIPGVTYYYKLAAQGQLNESVFPVVISAGLPLAGVLGGQSKDSPGLVLPGKNMRLYVRKSGHIKLERTLPDAKVLIDDTLSAGVFEINSTGPAQTFKVTIGPSFEQTVSWPLR